MAAMVTAVPVSSVNNVAPNNNALDEDDKFLYGENTDAAQQKNEAESEDVKVNGESDVKNDEENEGEDDEGEFDESEDDDDDNINVHIGEVNTSANSQYATTASWKKDGAATAAATTTATGAATAAAGAKALPQGQKKIDVNTVGLINGQPIYEYDMDADQEDIPWRKPGADISDYFNYGFTEDTWKQYCEKQRRLRVESTRVAYTVPTVTGIQPSVAHPPGQQIELEVLPDGRTRVKAGPPPDRKVEGAIHVIGSDDARRKQKEDELLALALGSHRMMAPPTFQQPRMYTGLPPGGVVFNPLGAPQMPAGPPGSQPDLSQQHTGVEPQNTSQGQQIQSIGAPSAMTSVMPPGIQYLSAGPGQVGMQLGPGGAPIFPPPNVGMDMGAEHFMHPGSMPPPFGFPRPNSDSEFDSDGESRRHRGRRDSLRHSRRHRDRSDRDRDRERSSRDRDRDRSRTDHRDRSSSKRRHESRSSDKKKHSRSSSSRPEQQDDSSEKKSKRKVKTEIKQEPIDPTEEEEASNAPPAATE